MKVKLLVSEHSEPCQPKESVFDQSTITIGRHSSNDLVLPDTKKIVSKKHARIDCHGQTFQLIDLNSKNCTYLNNRRLDPGKTFSMQNGDRFRIGDYTLQFFIVDKPCGRKMESIDEKLIRNPFQKSVSELHLIMDKLNKQYMEADSDKRSEWLHNALMESFGSIDSRDVQSIVTHFLAEQYGNHFILSPHVEDKKHSDLVKKPDGVQVENQPFRTVNNSRMHIVKNTDSEITPSRPCSKLDQTSSSTPCSESIDPSQTTRIDMVLDVLFESLIKLVKGPWQFRLEFIGQTIVDSPESFSIHTRSKKELKKCMLNSEIDSEEFQNHLTAIHEASSEVLLHQIAVLDGYKESVREGITQVLSEIDPDTLKREMEKKSINIGPVRISYHRIPLVLELMMMKKLKWKFRELMKEDRNTIEKRIFRPAFIRGYTSTISSIRQ